MLKIQAYYELKYFESGFAAIDTLKHYMKNNKEFSEDIKNKYGYLIRFVEKIYTIRINRYSIFDIEKIIDESDKKLFVKNHWYREKLEELKKLYSSKSRLYKTP